jgi:Protein of unknown function (DUF3179)
VFRAAIDGQPLEFDNAGVVGGNEVFRDRGTGSRWQQSSLQAISGPLRGKHLPLYPFLLTDWREWRRLHPDTLVLKPLPGYAERIPEMNDMIRVGVSAKSAAPKGVLRVDSRLAPHTMILGLDVSGASEAFPLKELRKAQIIEVELGREPVVVVHQGDSDTTTAFTARAAGRELHFEPLANAGATELTDRETKSRWTAYGECTQGPLKGSRLRPLILEPEYWFAWSEFHPDTKIFEGANQKTP